MKVVIFGPYSMWTPHLETDLEIAERHLRAGDEVTWFTCRRELGICEQNPEHLGRRCMKCIGRRERGLGLLSGPVTRASHGDWLTDADRARIDALPTRFDTRAELERLELDGFDLGMAVLSSVIWIQRDAQLDLGVRADWITRFLRASAEVYLGMRNRLRAEPPDRVYVFNGRMAPMRAVLRACQELGVPCFVHERGCDLQHYSLSENALWHDIGACEARIRAAWASAHHTDEEKQALAEGFYAARARGRIGSWHSFTEAQVAGALPAGFDAARRNVAFYTSSEFEYAAISREWASPFGDDPTGATIRFIEALAKAHPEVHVNLRLHPNPDGSDASTAARHMALEGPNLTVIAPEAEVDTYALLRACDVVVVTGSTVGIEAAWWGKPSILMGRSMWEGLGSTYRPQDLDALVGLVGDADLPPLDRAGARMFGYYMATYGEPYEHFEADGVRTGRFMGTRVKPTWRYAMASRLMRLGRLVGLR